MTVLPFYEPAAIVMSVVSLTATIVVMFIFRHYFRSLQFLQMSLSFAALMASTAFSRYLYTSNLSFNKTFLNICDSGDFVCSNGFLLSFGVVLVGVLLFTFLFVVIRKTCIDLKYEPVLLSLKGFIVWIYYPLAVSSTYFLISGINSSSMNTIIASGIVLGLEVLFPIFQLIGYKCIQEEDTPIWRKWVEFLNYLRSLSIGILIGLSIVYNQVMYLHFITVSLVVYTVIYAIKGQFKHAVAERVIFILGDCAFLVLFLLFKYSPTTITDYDLDFFVLVGILLVDLILYLIRMIRLACFGQNEGKVEVNPEETANVQEIMSPQIEKKKNKNSYEHESGSDLQNSRDNLPINASPPKKRKF